MASSSSPSPHWKYDVFLNFRGDTRKTFTAHLHEALCRRGIKTFIDEPELEKGHFISPALLTAIRNSMFCIIVLSQNYASSSWCLEELVEILKSKASTPGRVLPIFYNVYPSDIRKQKGEFGKSFWRFVENLTDSEWKNRVETWREALKQISKIVGWNSLESPEPSIIKEIISKISSELFSRFSIDEQYLAGIDYRIEKVMSLLRITSSDVIIIGICGMGGVGKTTLANAVYRKISHEFRSTFLENAGEIFRKEGLISLKQKLLSELVVDKNLNIKGCTSLKGILCREKFLVVLDNVKDEALLDYFTANLDSFYPGSRIIITTREKDLLTSFSVKYYEVETLDNHEALQVLGKYSSKHELPADDQWELSFRIISYAQGLPLALKILGPLLFGKEKSYWRSHLDKLESSTPHPKIQRVLQISYDELDNYEKNIFLDIACFFKDEDKDHVMEIHEACGFFPDCGLKTLLGKSLITISDNKLKMHDLIQAMAMEVVRQNSPNDPGKRSRLWSSEDASHVLKKETGTKKVEGIFLDLSNLREIKFTSKAFAKMVNLRLLRVHAYQISQHSKRKGCEVQFSLNFTFHSRDLRYFYWHGYSLRSLPVEFNPENLVELDMRYSHMNHLWEGEKALEKLKFMELSHSQFLVKTPDLSRAINLHRLVLEGCTGLLEVHPSLAYLKTLVFLSFRDCINLRRLPSSFELASLEILILSGCSKLRKFVDRGEMKHLKELFLGGTAIEEVPSSIDQCAPGLVVLNLANSKNLKTLPNGICNLESLETLHLSDCSKLTSLPHDFGKLKSLRKLCADRTALRGLPDSFIDLGSTLKEVSFNGCGGSATFSSWIPPRKKSYSLDFLFPQLSTFHSLVKVEMSNCNIKDGMLLHSLCLLPSLTDLNLSGNNFVQLPSSFSRLYKLESLVLKNCRRLQALPELSSSIGTIEAQDCISLARISNLRARYIDFTNCLNFGDYPSIIKSMHWNEAITYLSNTSELEHFDLDGPFSALIPGNKIPEWFSHQNEGHEVDITPSPNLNSNTFLGLALCLVLNHKDVGFDRGLFVICYLDFYSLDGVNYRACTSLVFSTQLTKLDHLVLGLLRSRRQKEWRSIKISFTIPAAETKITRCGVRLIYIEDIIEHMSAPQTSSVVLQELND